MDPEDRDPAYFNLVLKHIRSLVFTPEAVSAMDRRMAERRRPPVPQPTELPVPGQHQCALCRP